MPYNVLRKPVLIIDPGHGGKDPGGGTNQFWKEKDMVLDISLYQYKRFKELGVPVQLTRDKDVYLSPSERTKIIKNSGAKYCISNHINAGGGDGAETIHSIYSDGKLANQLAAEIAKEGQNIRRVFTRTLPSNAKADYYFMHRETGAVETDIVEYGFADSKMDDVQQLKDHWMDYAEAIVRAFCKFINHPYKFPSKADGWKKESGKWFFYVKGNKETGWVKWKNKWYFLNDQGEMQNGWIKDKGKWYYLNPDPDKGEMMTGVIQDKGKLYYLNPDGSMIENAKVNVTLKANKDGSLTP